MVIVCNSCQGKFRLKTAMPGRRIKCPRCSEPISIPAESPPPTPAPKASSKRDPKNVPDRKPEREEPTLPSRKRETRKPRKGSEVRTNDDRRGRKNAAPKASSNRSLWIGIGTLAVAFILIATAVFLNQDTNRRVDLTTPPASTSTLDTSSQNSKNDSSETLTLESLLERSEKDFDLARTALMISDQYSQATFDHEVRVESYLKQLDKMARSIQKRINDSMNPREVIKTINHYLYDELNYKSSQNAWDPANLFLDMVIDGQQGYCLGLSTLWIVLAERIDWRGEKLPIYGVSAPQHIFVRWDCPTERLNIETLHIPPVDMSEEEMKRVYQSGGLEKLLEMSRAGQIVPGSTYIEKYAITDLARREKAHMANLTKKQVVAMIYGNQSSLEYTKIQKVTDPEVRKLAYVKIESYLAQSVKFFPRSGLTLRNRAHYWMNCHGDFRKALTDIEQVLRWEKTADTYLVQAMAYRGLRKYDKALEALDHADKSPSMQKKAGIKAQIARNRALIYYDAKQYEKALTYCDEVLKKSVGTNELKGAALILFLFRIKLYNQMKAYDLATAAAELIIAAYPTEMAVARSRLGRTYLELGDLKRARTLFERALQMDKTQAEALYGLGLLHKKNKQYSKACDFIGKALVIDQTLSEARRDLAESQRLLERS